MKIDIHKGHANFIHDNFKILKKSQYRKCSAKNKGSIQKKTSLWCSVVEVSGERCALYMYIGGGHNLHFFYFCSGAFYPFLVVMSSAER